MIHADVAMSPDIEYFMRVQLVSKADAAASIPAAMPLQAWSGVWYAAWRPTSITPQPVIADCLRQEFRE